MENSIYLGENGISSTSAAYLANLAKEQLKEAEAKLEHLSFVNKSVELINGTKKNLRYGCTDPETVEEYLETIARMHSWCAWIREAIKYKDQTLNKIESLNVYDYMRLKGIDIPERPKIDDPVYEQDIINEMDIKSRNRYLELEAYASTFGQFIHPDGDIAEAREDLLKRVEIPNEVDGKGRDMVIYSYTPSANVDEVNKTYLSIQNKYRNYEKQLNAIKFQIREAVNKRNLAANQKYQTELQKHNNIMENLKAELNVYITEERERVANLKIVIPDRLKNIYEYLESLGK